MESLHFTNNVQLPRCLMESLHFTNNVQLPRVHHSRGMLLSRALPSLSFNGHGSRHAALLFSKQYRTDVINVRCCAPAHPLLHLDSTENRSLKRDVKVHDEHTLLLKHRASEIVTDLRGSCIYLVGMMGSGKTTIGKVLADALGYHFIDSDKVIEDAAGGVSVAQLFKQHDEESFRDAETEVLKQLSCNGRLVVATGGGIVVRPLNWSYLRYGVTVWLDVPLKSLAERVVAAGTHSRPLLGESNGDTAHSQALARLTSLFERRASCYANADVTVSLHELASSQGLNVRDLTPTIIAIQALEEISEMIVHKKQKENGSATLSI